METMLNDGQLLKSEQFMASNLFKKKVLNVASCNKIKLKNIYIFFKIHRANYSLVFHILFQMTLFRTGSPYTAWNLTEFQL